MFEEFEKQTKRINKTDLEALIDLRVELKEIAEQANDLLDQVNAELLVRVDKTADKQLAAGDFLIRKVERLNFNAVPLEVAKKFRAIKKTPDASVLKPLFAKGVKIPGVTRSAYVLVSEYHA